MSEMHWPKITKDTPLTEVKRIHQAIWDYAIEHGEKPETPYNSNCAACNYAKMLSQFGDEYCSRCPIVWPRIPTSVYINRCFSTGGPYSKWRNSTGEEKTELARQIRDLPFKYELEDMKND